MISHSQISIWPQMNDQRNLEVDTLRGLACILLVVFHVIGSNASSGLQVTEGLLRDINDTLAYLRMPLFTFLSGIVYAYRPFREKAIIFIRGKARRLLIPMITVGTAFAILRHGINASSLTDTYWLTLHIYPVAHFWFVEAIFLIFLLIVVLEKINLLKNLTASLIVLLISVVAHTIGTNIKIFSFDGFIYLLPFFLLGNIIQRFDFREKISLTSSLLIITTGCTLTLMIHFNILNANPRFTFVGLITGSILCIGLISSKMKILALARIGGYSYSIYIFHVFFTAPARMLLENTPVNNLSILILSGVVTGIVGPIVIQYTVKKSAILSTLLIGKKYVKKFKANSTSQA